MPGPYCRKPRKRDQPKPQLPPYITPVASRNYNHYRLDLHAAIGVVDPRAHGIPLPAIDPLERYVTSGEAIIKSIYLIKELRELATRLAEFAAALPAGPLREEAAAAELEALAAAARGEAMRSELEKLRGDATWLESAMEGGGMPIVHAVNARSPEAKAGRAATLAANRPPRGVS